MEIKFIPLDYDYFDYQGRNYVKIIGRDEKGKKTCIIDSCPVYLWAVLKQRTSIKKISKIIKKISKIQLESKGRTTRVEKVELLNKNFLGKEVQALKIHATNYKDLHEIASHIDYPEVEKRRGYDLGYITHYIIEKKLDPLKWYSITGEVLNNSFEFGGIDSKIDVDLCLKVNKLKQIKEQKFIPNAIAYDIETDSLKIGEGEILMISLVGKNFKKVITWKKTKKQKQSFVEYVEDEAELLERFTEYIKKQSPDFLVGYFSDGFDLPYIKARAEKNKVSLPLGVDGTQPKFSRGVTTSAKINGIVHIDLLKFIRTAYSQYMSSESLTLNEVSKEFLNDTKKDFNLRHSSELKEVDWKEYYDYNLHDSVLALGLFDKFWPDMLEFSKVIRTPIFDLSRSGLSKYVEGYILHNLEKYNEIPEKRPTYDEIQERRHRKPVEGAFVYNPTPGLYENIAIFDFTSMHTSIIISMNLSKGTLLEKKEKNSYESPEINFKGKNTKFYFRKKPGFIPLLLENILEQRKKYKDQWKKNPSKITLARSNAFKLLSASVHGYIGFFGARYYSLESSAAILSYVRKFNQEVIENVKKEGHQVIFGDTDSVGFLMENKNESQIKKLLKKLNSKLPGVMELELEGFFKRGLWVTTRSGKVGAKKKYALLDKNNKLKIRGFETVRRDWCNLARKLQNKIINVILKEGNEKKALTYAKQIIKKVKKRDIDKEDLMIKTQLKKPLDEYLNISPHVVAARKMKEQNIPISQGGLIKYYIAETREKKKLVRDKVKLPNEEGKYEIDYYLNKQILPAIENIFQVLNIDIKELIEGKKQTTLGDF